MYKEAASAIGIRTRERVDGQPVVSPDAGWLIDMVEMACPKLRWPNPVASFWNGAMPREALPGDRVVESLRQTPAGDGMVASCAGHKAKALPVELKLQCRSLARRTFGQRAPFGVVTHFHYASAWVFTRVRDMDMDGYQDVTRFE